MSERRRKGLSYYVKINFHTLQGRITSGFVVIIMLFSISVIISHSFWNSINRRKSAVITDIKPLPVHAYGLLDKLKQTQNNLNLYVYLNEASFDVNNRNLWLTDIPAHKDSVLFYTNKLSNEDAKITFTTLNKQIGELKQLQQKARNIHVTSYNTVFVKQLIKTDLNFTLNEAEKSILGLVNISKSVEKQLLDKIDIEINYYYRILLFVTIAIIILGYSFGLQMFAEIFKWIKEIRNKVKELSYGNLPEHLPIRNNEFKGVNTALNLLTDNLSLMRNYAIDVGLGNFFKPYKIFGSQSALGKSINEMGNSLQQISETERKRNWTRQNLSEFAQILQINSQDIHSLCREVIGNLVKSLEIIQGGIFILTKEEEKEFFELEASFAYNKERYLERKVGINEGLIGRVYKELQKVIITDVPEHYIEITSGLGNTKPRFLILLPLMNEEKIIKGVIELASLEPLKDYQIEFVERVCTNIASTLTLALTSQQNQKLLVESQKFAESLRVKEEESRNNAEELNFAREKLNRELENARNQYLVLDATLDLTKEGIIVSDENGIIEMFNKNAESIFGFREEEILGKNIKVLIAEEFYKKNGENIIHHLIKEQNGLNEVIPGIKKDGKECKLKLDVHSIDVNKHTKITTLVKEIE